MLKLTPKILIIIFISIFIIQLICLVLLLFLPQPSHAAGINFTPQVPIGNYNFNSSDTSTGNIAEYIKAIYQYAIGIVGILAAVILMYGGVLWIVAGGSSSQVGEAKAWIGGALTGLILALTSYLILNTINPALVNLQTATIPPVGIPADLTYGCCIIPGMPNNIYKDLTETTCKTNIGATWQGGVKCPTNLVSGTCCAATSGDCAVVSTDQGLTEQGCRDKIINMSLTFRNYVADNGICSGSVGVGCVAK